MSRRGSITIEQQGLGSQSPQATPLGSALLSSTYLDAVNDIAAVEQLRAEHESSLDEMRAEVQRLYALGDETQAKLSEAIQTLRVDAAHSEAQAQANAQGTAHLRQLTAEISRLRNQVDHMQATMSSKDAELRLLHAQQDRTMNLLDTCTKRRDLLAEDNRLLRDELNGLLRMWENELIPSTTR